MSVRDQIGYWLAGPIPDDLQISQPRRVRNTTFNTVPVAANGFASISCVAQFTDIIRRTEAFWIEHASCLLSIGNASAGVVDATIVGTSSAIVDNGANLILQFGDFAPPLLQLKGNLSNVGTVQAQVSNFKNLVTQTDLVGLFPGAVEPFGYFPTANITTVAGLPAGSLAMASFLIYRLVTGIPDG